MSKHGQLVTQMYADVITIDPQGARFACRGIDKHGIDRLGPATPEQEKEWRAKRKAAQKKSNREILATYVFFGLIFLTFLLGRMSLGSNPAEDIQNVTEFVTGLMK